jgi:hypothetical protein
VTERDDLATRVANLERVQQITALKYRYWRACDAKDPETFRSCFVRHGAAIEYGPMGSYDDADGLVAVFTRIALQKIDGRYVVLDTHHGIHPDITVLSGSEAVGTWTLHFRQVNLVDATERLSSGEYEDRYVVEDGQWRIAATRYRPHWSLTRPLPPGAIEQP